MKKIIILICLLLIPINGSSFLKDDKTENLVYILKIGENSYKEWACGYALKENYHYTSAGDYISNKVHKPGYPHKWEVTTDKKGLPIKTRYQIGMNDISFNIDKNGQVCLKGVWNGVQCNTTKKFPNDVVIENSMLVRKIDFSSNEKVVFDLIKMDKMPDLKSHEMFFQVIGDETVKVPAGTFKCKKILFSLTGIKGMFFKAYYYISNDKNRYIVKIDNLPVGGCTELFEYKSNLYSDR